MIATDSAGRLRPRSPRGHHRRWRWLPRSARAWPRMPSAPSSTAGAVDLRAPLSSAARCASSPPRAREAGPFLRHSAEHVMADAVQRLWPGTEIDAGRQDHSEKYPVRLPLSARLHRRGSRERSKPRCARSWPRTAPSSASRSPASEAAEIFRERGESLKLERLDDIPAGETITLFRHGRFTDLCRGPHVQRAGQIGAVRCSRRRASTGKATSATSACSASTARRSPARRSCRSTPRSRSRRAPAIIAGWGPSSISSASRRWRRRRRSSIPKARWSTTC